MLVRNTTRILCALGFLWGGSVVCSAETKTVKRAIGNQGSTQSLGQLGGLGNQMSSTGGTTKSKRGTGASNIMKTNHDTAKK